MYKLYYSPGSCSLAVHAVLNHIGSEFELKNVAVKNGEEKPADFLKANPRASVPTLEIDGFVLREGAAILIYLLDSNKKNDLLPADGLERASVLEWLSFANSSLHPLYGRLFFMAKSLGDKASENPIYGLTIKQINKYWEEIQTRLDHKKYIAGDKITVADILITVIANWSSYFGSEITFGAKTKAYFARVVEFPALKKSMEKEGIEHHYLS